MKRILVPSIAFLIALGTVLPPAAYCDERTAQPKATLGEPAPSFTLMDQNGEEVSLSDFQGRIVVLEWVNYDCPFVIRHYKTGTMTSLAEKFGDSHEEGKQEEGVVWLAINSTHYATAEGNLKFGKEHDIPYPILSDRSGDVGRMYDAQTTPHMFIVDRDGTLVYMGAIDSDPRGKGGDGIINYVEQALRQIAAGEEISTPHTKPYGCSVKYAMAAKSSS